MVSDRLNGKSLGHDGTSFSDDLQVGHGTAAMSGAGGAESSKSGWRSLFEEGAKSARLAEEESVHDDYACCVDLLVGGFAEDLN